MQNARNVTEALSETAGVEPGPPTSWQTRPLATWEGAVPPAPKGFAGASTDMPGGTLRRAERRGFTLIEMLAVLGIVAALLLISGLAFQNFGRAAGIRGAVLNTRSYLSLARQRAITERKKMVFKCDNEVNAAGRKTGYSVIRSFEGRPLTETNRLTEGTYFTAAKDITFNYDGSCSSSPDTGALPIDVGIKEDRVGNTALSATITIQPLTGNIKTSSWVDD